MRIDRVKLISEMARQNMKVSDLYKKAIVSRCTVCAARSGKTVSSLTAKRLAAALGVPLESLLEDGQGGGNK